jgi:hypothetical protein
VRQSANGHRFWFASARKPPVRSKARCCCPAAPASRAAKVAREQSAGAMARRVRLRLEAWEPDWGALRPRLREFGWSRTGLKVPGRSKRGLIMRLGLVFGPIRPLVALPQLRAIPRCVRAFFLAISARFPVGVKRDSRRPSSTLPGAGRGRFFRQLRYKKRG